MPYREKMVLKGLTAPQDHAGEEKRKSQRDSATRAMCNDCKEGAGKVGWGRRDLLSFIGMDHAGTELRKIWVVWDRR